MAKKIIKFIRSLNRFFQKLKKISLFFNIKNFFTSSRQLFIRGLFSLLPIILTLYISYLFFIFLYRIFDFSIIFIPKEFKQFISAKIITVSLTIIIFILIAIITGFIAKTLIGRNLQKLVESFFLPIPLVNKIYQSIRQLLKLIAQNENYNFTKVVLVEYPSADKWSVAFLTGKCTPKLCPDKNKIYYTVFIPTTPNPTTGFLCILEKESIVETDISIDEAFKLIFSGGIIKDNESYDKLQKDNLEKK